MALLNYGTMMTVEQWNSLSTNSREELIEAVFGNQYTAYTHAQLNPAEDSVIQEVLRLTVLKEDIAHIDIHKEIRVK